MNLSRVAEATKLHYGRIYRLAHKPEQQPSYETVSKVAAYLESRQLTKAA
jgi:DNA-binding phage protein